MTTTTDFSAVKAPATADGTGKITGSLTGQAKTTTTYDPQTAHVHIDLAVPSGAHGTLDTDVPVQKDSTSVMEDVKITKVTDSDGRTYTVSADGKSFTSA